MGAFLIREEEKRLAIAEAARRAQEAAEQVARDAEAKEAEALENAKLGEIVDVAAVTQQADQAF